MDISEIIVVYDVEVGRCSKLTESMDLYDYKGQGHSLTLVQGHSDSTFSNYFFSWESTMPIEAKFHVEPQRDRRTKVCSNGPGHITKMATMPIYGKKIFLSKTKRPMSLNVCMQHQVLKYYPVCSNDDPGLTMTYFMTGQIWSFMILYGKKLKQWIFQKLS